MKKQIIALLSLCFIISLTACKNTPADETSTIPLETLLETQIEETQVTSHPPIAAIFLSPNVTEETASDGTLIFSHSIQNMFLTTQDPDVAQKITLDFINRMDSSSEASQKILESAKQNYDPEHWTPYLCHLLYNPTRIDQTVLSMYGDYVEYNGSMHASKTNLSVNYDLTTGDVLTLAGILKANADPSVFPDLVIEQLRFKEEELSLYPGYEEFVRQRFAVDSNMDEDFYFTSTGICFYFEPYQIAPYSSGSISVEIPYEKLSGLVDNSYFPAPSVKTTGMMEIAPFHPDALESETEIVEAILDDSGMMLQATAQDAVHNVKLIMRSASGKNQDKILFMAQLLVPGEAFLIQASQDQLNSLILTYENSAGIQEIHL